MAATLRKAFLVGLVFLLTSTFTFAQGENVSQDPGLPSITTPSPPALIEEYDPHTLVLQLSEGSSEAFAVQSLEGGAVVTGLASLDRLMARYGVSQVIVGRSSIQEGRTAADQDHGEQFSKTSSKYVKLVLGSGVDPRTAAADFSRDPHVVFAEPNYIYRASYIPNDPFFSNQWSLKNTGQTGGAPGADISAPAAWDINMGDPNIVIAIIDTGVMREHLDLAANIYINTGEIPNNGIDDDGNGYVDDDRGWDFVTATSVYPGEDGAPPDNDPSDFHGHGTHVSGIAAMVGNNGLGGSGVCPRCSIMALRAGYKAPGGGAILEHYDVLSAINYAADNGARVISMSFGSWSESPITKAALENAHANGIVLVAAAGNHGDDDPMYPASYSVVIGVAATDHNDQRSVWQYGSSAYGYQIDLAAPGSSILSTVPNNGYTFMSGTSMSAPIVAGAAGLVLSHRPHLSPEEVRRILVSTTDPKPFDQYIGSGRLNVYKALQMSAAPEAQIFSPETNQFLKGQVQINGTAKASSFQGYVLEYGYGDNPLAWQVFYQSKTPVNNAELGIWNTSGVPNGSYLIRLRVSDTSGNTSLALRRVLVDHDLLPGWPINVGYNEIFSPLIVDLNGDGQKEIVAATFQTGTVYVWRADGTNYPGWPRKIGDQIKGAAAAADLTGDGHLEIVISSLTFGMNNPPNYVYVFRHDGSNLPGWPKNIGGHVLSTPVLGDLDGDGNLDIIASSVVNLSDKKEIGVFSWKKDGSPLQGWPKLFPVDPHWWEWLSGGPVLGDLTGDGNFEVVVGLRPGKVYAWDRYGQVLPGWPQQMNPNLPLDFLGPPRVVLGDINNNGNLEIAATTGPGEIRVWNASGQLLPGWPQNLSDFSLSPPGLVDFGNGTLTITHHANNGFLYAWRHDGSLLPGWPVSVPHIPGNPSWEQPIAADVNGDGQVDLIWGTWDQTVIAVRANGSLISEWTKQMIWNGYHTPTLGDVTGDGFLELAAPSRDFVYLWRLGIGVGESKVQWSTYQADAQRSGRFEKVETSEPTPTPPTQPSPSPFPTPGPPPGEWNRIYAPLIIKP